MATMLTEFAGTCNSLARLRPVSYCSAQTARASGGERAGWLDQIFLAPQKPPAQQNCAFQPAAKTAMRRQRGGYVRVVGGGSISAIGQFASGSAARLA
jgi:hypothetical protein